MTALLDPYGRPARYRQSGVTLYADPQSGGLRQTRPSYAYDYGQMLSPQKFRAMISDSRLMFAQFSPVSASVFMKSSFVSSSGWAPVFEGADKDWGIRALAALQPFLSRSTNKGFSFGKTQTMGSRYWDVDGDYFKLLAKDSRGGPITQILEAPRVGSRNTADVVGEGRFEGLSIQNGIVYSPDGAEVAYKVLGAVPKFDLIVPASELMHCADFTFSSECRPYSSIAYGVLDFYDGKETRGFQKIKNKIESAISVVEKNTAGKKVNPNSPPGGAGAEAQHSASGFQVEQHDAGMYRYLKSGTGELTAFQSSTPSGEWQQFDNTIISSAILAMGWRPEMLDLSRLKGAGFRGFADIINKTIRDRHKSLAEFALRELQFKVACLIDRGDIPENADWAAWSFPKPGRFDVDRKNTQALDEANVRMGRASVPGLIREDGGDPDKILAEQAEWLAKRNKTAALIDVDPNELGTLTKPGDAFAQAPAAPAPAQSPGDPAEE